MKLLKRNISEKDGTGSVTLRAEEPEDMWHVFNLIHKGDVLKTTTVRKVVKEGATGSTSSQRLRMSLALEIDHIDFDPAKCLLRIKGINVEENPHVRMGASHTTDLELNKDFTLKKNCWDLMSIERIETACNVAKQADVAAVVMQTGLAHLCLITSHMTVIRAKIESSIPRKRPGNTSHAKGVERFYDNIVQSLKRHIDFNLVKCVLLASPGFVKDDFLKYMLDYAIRTDDKVILENKARFILVHASSGHKHALDEVLADQKVKVQLEDTKAAGDVKCLDTFFEMLHSDQDRAYYGYNHVVRANDQNAVETLLIADSLFRSQDVQTRRKYVTLVEKVRENGGLVRVFSSLHVSGEKLAQLSGIAAILRMPLPELEEDGDSDDDNDIAADVLATADSTVGDLDDLEYI
ncbi:mRNA surveillance protein pelota, variant 1 [Aphanomyces invadans]|uniref:Protein pelota homolog n=1 Tax=Aphanomyces invadans TaxID=157072 RepID=A0A024UI99_9STRA|nr:mRNA surveillance protein pelota [Aphanomyces invadans]XP_008865667.1 mRNA surveillance protein pelota, variant 1 [Aphanomyces invadans]ETW05889.1 mRNA surveillance protein pelota [Aphanomyces invadans]ETW05890.1 mRNA surveillance protein pelota, variant 1 [Aphanomyces invadans]|eukprot:XP_008865666.1 mRNA surveillance protein pelota [Aphanomyces invadans]